jgi:hypothetical protein
MKSCGGWWMTKYLENWCWTHRPAIQMEPKTNNEETRPTKANAEATRSPMKNDRLDAALDYVRRGWEVFPATRMKTGYSIQSRGFDNGAPWGKTKDEAEVREYWRRLPNANIGLPMGIGSGIFDIECDTVEGHPDLEQDGATSLAALERRHGKLPATLMFESPSGSVHRLFKHPSGDFRVKDPKEKLGIGIDVRGDGAMSIAPPSRTRKGVYRWINRRRIATAPAWLVAMVCKPARVPLEATGEPQADLASLTLAMAMIPNPDCDWESWNRVGMALFNATAGSEAGFRLFDAWSQRSRKYNAGKTAQKWKALDGCPPNEIGGGTIFYLADEAVPGWQGRMYYDASVIALIEEFHKLLGEP